MSYNGNGLFTNPFNWNNDKTNGVLITASRMQTQDAGFATGLSTVICKDGQQICTAQIPFAVGIALNQGTAGAPSIAVTGDLTTGLYQSSAGALDISISGARAAGFTSAGLVNTAIGVATPSTGAFTTLTASGNFAVATNKFTVNASTGNSVIAGTLTTDTIIINNKCTIFASTGAIVSLAGATLGANSGTGGSVILNGSTSGSATIRVAASTGSSTIFRLPNNNGTSSFLLQTDGSGNTSWVTPPFPVSQPQHAFLTSGTSWNSPSNITSSTIFKITLVGAGGAGSSGNNNYYGASGATGIKWLSGLAASTGYTYAIGSAGAFGGTTAGGNTTFNNGVTTYTAGGGGGGGASQPAGGTCTNCDISVSGQSGPLVPSGTTIGQAVSSLWGIGASGSSGGSGNTATGYGGGGGFQANGSQGMILIEWIG